MSKGIPRDKSVQRTILHRLKIARGHLDCVIKMVENGEYCIDIVHQSLAIQAALKKIDRKILRNHLETCVAQKLKNGESRSAVDEVMKVIEKS